MNGSKFKSHKVVEASEARIMVGRASFVSALELDGNFNEVANQLETVRENVPLQIALQVYDLVSHHTSESID